MDRIVHNPEETQGENARKGVSPPRSLDAPDRFQAALDAILGPVSPQDRAIAPEEPPRRADLRQRLRSLERSAEQAELAELATPAELQPREEYYDLLDRFRRFLDDRGETFQEGMRRAIAVAMGEPETFAQKGKRRPS